MKYYICLFVIMFATGCSKRKNALILNPQFDSILNAYLENNPEDSIYSITFFKQNSCNFFTIQGSDIYYDSDFIDGCFEVNNKIITYCSLNKTISDSLLINPNNDIHLKSLQKFTDWKDVTMYNDRPDKSLTYKIISKNNIVPAEMIDFKKTNEALGTNCVSNNALNIVLNKQINEGGSLITYLRFHNINGINYVCIGQDFTLDRQICKGVFYRNEYPVAVYVVGNMTDIPFIDKSQLKPVQEFSQYRYLHRNYPIFPEQRYRIKDNELLDVDEKTNMKLQFFNCNLQTEE